MTRQTRSRGRRSRCCVAAWLSKLVCGCCQPWLCTFRVFRTLPQATRRLTTAGAAYSLVLRQWILSCGQNAVSCSPSAVDWWSLSGESVIESASQPESDVMPAMAGYWRPHPGGDVPHLRRRHPVERGSRLHRAASAAAGHRQGPPPARSVPASLVHTVVWSRALIITDHLVIVVN